MDDLTSSVKNDNDPHVCSTPYGLLAHAIRLVPLTVLRRVGVLAASAAWAMHTRSRAVTETNIRLSVPEIGYDAQRRLARDSLRESGRLLTESLGVWSRPPRQVLDWILEVEGAELLSAAERLGRGVICLVPHFGNWEVLCVYLASRYRFATLYEPQRIAWADRWIANGRSRSGARIWPATISGLRSLRRTLTSGYVVGLLPDQVPAVGLGSAAPFFGRPALTPTLAWRLAATSQAPVFMASARRSESPAGFSIRIEPFDAGWALLEEGAALTALNRAIEGVVRHAPEQYQWEYKRFKHAEPGMDAYKQL